jgi:hypothetical protein
MPLVKARKWLPALPFMLVVATAAQAADVDVGQRALRVIVRHHRVVLAPERHVVESVRPPYSGNYVFNGRPFTAKTPACARWVSGEAIRLVAGSWNGACTSAAFRNVPRRMICEMWCS